MPSARFNQLYTSFLLIAVSVFIIYSSGLHSPWILDDKPNILDNQLLHLQNISFSSLKNTFYAYPQYPGKLYRPVACLSFALNWFIGQDNPLGYHIVNISIHVLTAFFLYLTCLKLLQLSLPSNIFYPSGYSIALLTALLWSMNPMQSQAVTYIVQRMAALAAFFSISGIFFFLKARTTTPFYKILFYSMCCLISFLFALGSKENAIIFPFSLLLIEFIFFRHLRIGAKAIILVLFAIVVVLAMLLALGNYTFLPGLNYEHRTFTLSERALTAPRILLFYLSQLFFPLATRLSVEHDIILSSSLFSPWTTLPACGICFLLIAFGLFIKERNKFLALAILFYFLNHVVESTIINLELIFEHRNYLPSLFLFLPLAKWWVELFHNQKKYSIRSIAIIAIPMCLFFLGSNTYKRNQVWASSLTLWQDAHRKAPNSSRAAINLAKEYVNIGNIEQALVLSKESYYLYQPTKNYAQALSLNGQGVIANIRGENKKASQFFQQSLEFVSDYGEARKNLILSLCKQHRFQEALDQFSSYTDSNLEGFILLWMNRPEQSLKKFRSVPEILEVENMAGIGKALSLIGSYKQANFYLRQAAPFSLHNELLQVENLLRADRLDQAKIICGKIFSYYPAGAIFKSLSADDFLKIPLDRKLITPLFIQEAKLMLPQIREQFAALEVK